VSVEAQSDKSLFENGPPTGFQRRLGIIKAGRINVGLRAVLVVAIGWAPLIILAASQDSIMRSGGMASLLSETGAHARYLVAAPLLILAEVGCATQLSAIVRQFVDAGVITDEERPKYNAAVDSTRALLSSNIVEICVVALAYGLAAAAALSTPFEQIPIWHKTAGVVPAFSPAGWWHILVSMPLLLILLLGWMWRLALWTRLLWLIARLNLRLMASHPDHAAGIGFVGYSIGAFSIVALALAAIVAGRIAHVVLQGGSLTTHYFIFVGGLLLAVIVLFVAPLFVFTPVLIKAWRQGTLEYGGLADRIGTAFEDQWIKREGQAAGTSPDKQEFSTTTDLYSIVANVYAMRLVPIDFRSVAVFGVAMLLPFIPAVFLALPAEEILSGLNKLLF
jgi:hypothetical protein